MMVFALVSCSTEELGNGGNTPASSKGGVQLVLSTDGFNEVGSRAVDESVIHDVNILQYINGALATEEIVYLDESKADFSKAVEVSGLKEATATLMEPITDADGNKVEVMNEGNGLQNFIFIIANYGHKIDREKVVTFKLLKDFAKEFSGKTDMENLPMTGSYYGGINPTSTTQMKVTLQRAVAKINFTLDTSNFKVGGETPGQIVVNSIKLCNVPDSVTFYPCRVRPSLPKNGVAGKWNFGSQTPFPKAKYLAATSVTYGDDQNHSSTANTANTYTYVAYIPENARGSYSNVTDNKHKTPSNCESPISEENENKDKTYTYILVDLNYAMPDGSGRRATYKIYLGGNSTGDMNLLRNTQYNVTTSLYGANDADTRIDVVPDETGDGAAVLDPANCYMIDMSDVANGSQFLIPLSQVTKGWEKITEYDATQEDTKTTVEKMLKSGKWEIKTLWKTWDGPTNVKGTIAAGSTADTPIAKLNIPASVKNGNNAVVELVSTEDKQVYWSWHLWFTDYKPDKSTDAERKGQVHKYTASQTKYMMDRNLGAIATGITGAIARPTLTSEAIKYYGLNYQFGRKDPFVGSGNGSNYFVSIYDADGTLYNDVKNAATPPFKVEAGSASSSFLSKAAMNPFTYYTSSGNWTFESAGLWGEENDKTPFDPCPPGWRVSPYNTWANFSNYGWGKTVTGTAGSMYTPNGIQTWYPTCGFVTGNGLIYSIDEYGAYWSDRPASQSIGYCYFIILNRDVHQYDAYRGRAMACPVRCIQE